MNNKAFLAKRRPKGTLRPRKVGKKGPEMGLRKYGELMPSIPSLVYSRPQISRPSTTTQQQEESSAAALAAEDSTQAAEVSTQAVEVSTQAAEVSTRAAVKPSQAVETLINSQPEPPQSLPRNNNRNNSKQTRKHQRPPTRLKVPRVRGCVPVAQGLPITSWKLAHPS